MRRLRQLSEDFKAVEAKVEEKQERVEALKLVSGSALYTQVVGRGGRLCGTRLLQPEAAPTVALSAGFETHFLALGIVSLGQCRHALLFRGLEDLPEPVANSSDGTASGERDRDQRHT